MKPASPSISTATLTGMPSGRNGPDRIVATLVLEPGAGQRLDGLRRAALRIVEPPAHERPYRLCAVFFDEGLEPPLADSRRADGGEIVAEPLVGHADAAPAHADHVVDIPAVPLHLDTREDQRPLVINVLSRREISGGLAVSHIRLMRLDAHGEEMLALVEHRHQDGVIRGMAVPAIGIVVEEGVARAKIRVRGRHDLRLDVHAEDVNRHGLGRREHLVVRRDDGAGEIPRDPDHRRARAVQHGVRHLAADRVHAVRHDRKQKRTHLAGVIGRPHGSVVHDSRRPLAAVPPGCSVARATLEQSGNAHGSPCAAPPRFHARGWAAS